MGKVIETAIELILFLVVSYFVFYKSFLKALGKKYAKVATAKELTNIEENVKHEFRERISDYKAKINEEFSNNIEHLKAGLAKENLSYQITLAELTKIRFEKIEKLIICLIELQDYIRANMFWAENDEQFAKNKQEFNDLYNKADLNRKICTLYLSNELTAKIIEVLNNFHNAYSSFVKMYHTDPKKLGDISPFDLSAQQIRVQLSNENFKAFERLNAEIDNFPSLLTDLSTEFKKQIILKNIEN